MKKSRTAGPSRVVASPTVRSLPLVEVLVDTKAALFELMMQSGLQVLDALLEEDRTALCGPRYAHHAARHASRAGTVPSEVVLGGRKVAMQRPRVRAEGREVPLPAFQAVAQADPLNRRVVEQMLVGVATRQYARSLELSRFEGRIYAYLALLRDEYPSTDEPQAVHLEIDYPDAARDLSRWLPLIKWVLALPHYVVLLLLAPIAGVLMVIAWFAILFTGRYPLGIFGFLVGVFRWALRVHAYVFLLTTDRYPPFSLDR